MTTSEQQVQIAARLYDCRSAARGILGADYEASIERWKRIIRHVMATEQKNAAQACLSASKVVDGEPIAIMFLMAATVEVIESSERSPMRNETTE